MTSDTKQYRDAFRKMCAKDLSCFSLCEVIYIDDCRIARDRCCSGTAAC